MFSLALTLALFPSPPFLVFFIRFLLTRVSPATQQAPTTFAEAYESVSSAEWIRSCVWEMVFQEKQQLNGYRRAWNHVKELLFLAASSYAKFRSFSEFKTFICFFFSVSSWQKMCSKHHSHMMCSHGEVMTKVLWALNDQVSSVKRKILSCD